MFDRLLGLIAPHHCYSCGFEGALLCEKCKNYIISQPWTGCVVCGTKLAESSLCRRHRLPYQQAWCLAPRTKAIAALVDGLKFHRQQAAALALAELLAARLPELPTTTVVVPVPTTARHIRRRGYDHMALIARSLARLRGWRYQQPLARTSNITQHFAPSAVVRRAQAKRFFRARQQVAAEKTYLLIDDIFTTGSTLRAAASCLRQAGAQTVLAAVIARQGVAINDDTIHHG